MSDSKVTVVRDYGLDHEVEARVCRHLDVSTQHQFECFEDPDDYAQFLEEQKQENEQLARQRGKAANKKVARDLWINQKIEKAEKDMRESVALVEKLRSARLINNKNVKEKSDERNKENIDTESQRQKAKTSTRRKVTFSTSCSQSPSKTVKRIGKPIQPVRKSTILRQPVVCSENSRQQPGGLSDRNFTEFSRISECQESEASIGDKVAYCDEQIDDYCDELLDGALHKGHRQQPPDEIDFIPVRGPSREEDRSNANKDTCLRIPASCSGRSITLSAKSRHTGTTRNSTTSSRSSAGIPTLPRQSDNSPKTPSESGSDSGILSASIDLQSIAVMLDRIKKYRSSLKEKEGDNTTTISDSGFRPVDPPPTATARLTSTATTVNESLKTGDPGSNNKFKLNRQFLEKVLQFESSSPLSSLNSSTASEKVKSRKAIRKKKISTNKNIDDHQKSSSTSSSTLRTNTSHRPSKIDDVYKSSSTSSSTLRTNTSYKQSKRSRDQRDSRIISGNLHDDTNDDADYDEETVHHHDSTSNDPSSQQRLRYYIEKLLAMKHEDIQDLSVSTNASSESTSLPLSLQSTTSTSRISSENHSQSSGVLSSALKSSSSSMRSESSGKQVRFVNKSLDASEVEQPSRRNSTVSQALDSTLYRSLQTLRPDELDSGAGGRGHTSIKQQDKDVSEYDESSSVVNHSSYREIQQLYRLKRKQLEQQLKNIQNFPSYEEASNSGNPLQLSEGSLSSKSTVSGQSYPEKSSQQKIKSTLQLSRLSLTERSEPQVQENVEKIDSGATNRVRFQQDAFSFLSDVGTDSHSGSIISRIDLSSDISYS